MMSSRFNRRPRPQPTPKVCKSKLKPLPPPPPPPWPPNELIAKINWHGPFFPPLTFDVDWIGVVPRDPASGNYFADTPTSPDWVRHNLQIDLPNLRAMVTLFGYHYLTQYYNVWSAWMDFTEGQPFNFHVDTWNNQPAGHTIVYDSTS